MSEMYTTYTDNPDAWYEPLSDGSGWQLLDPATGTALTRKEPHQWIQDDPELQAGMLHLGRYGSNINLSVRLGRHNTVDDFGHDLADSVAVADAYCFERFGWDRNKHVDAIRAVQNGNGFPSHFGPVTRHYMSAAATLKPEQSFSDEPEADRSNLDDFIIKLRHWTPERGQVLDERAILKFVAMRTLRERYKVAKLGAECARLGLGVENPADVLATVGSNHGGLLTHIGGLGVRTSHQYVDAAGKPSEKGKILAGTSADGKIYKEDMAVLAA